MNSAYKDLSYDCVIPSALLFNENICPATARFYAVVRSLARMEGFCFATNEYLAKSLGCGITSVKRWLKSLEEEGFLETEYDIEGIHTTRKIRISNKFQEKFTAAQKWTPPSPKMDPPQPKNGPHKEKYTKDNYKTTTTPTPSEPPAKRKKSVVVVLSAKEKEYALKAKREFEKIADKWGEPWRIHSAALEEISGHYGAEYLGDQIKYMLKEHAEALKDQNTMKQKPKRPIDKPQVYLSMACERNWAKSPHIKQR